MTDELFMGLRWETLTAALLIVVLVGVADAVLRWLIRRKVRQDEARAAESTPQERESRYWIDRALVEVLPPVALLIWVNGLHRAVAVLIVELDLRDMTAFTLVALEWLRAVGTLVGFFWLLFRLGRVFEARLAAFSARTDSGWDAVLLPLVGKAVRLTLPLLALLLGVPTLTISPELQAIFRNGVSLILIATVAAVLYQLVKAAEELVLTQYRIDVADNLRARQIYTQVTVLKKVALVVIGIFTLASMLMVFESVRQFGTSILASAGIAGIIIGFAAQRSIATLLAGFQIAVTQPIRLDDVVIVENEWGRIEEITLTYVVVRIWDQRRLILPISYFIEQPFQNWTRTSAELLGTVFLYVDYRVPLQVLREELDRILEGSNLWDGRVKGIQVTDTREHTLEVRVLASAADASAAWDLRCDIRERLVNFLQRNYPESLPRLRAEVLNGDAQLAVQRS